MSLSLIKFNKENLIYNSFYIKRTTKLLFNAKENKDRYNIVKTLSV